jgi:3-oxoacyl-[acyl-carrier protein] reductase
VTLAAVVGHPGGPADVLVQGLSALELETIALAPTARDALASGLRAAGQPTLIVWAPAPGPAAEPTELLDHDPDAWDAVAAQPLREAVACFQAALDVLQTGAAGAIVALLPTLAMNGAAGLTGWSTAAEGLRSLVKVTARELAPRGITVNAVALPAHVLAGVGESLNRPGLPPARLGEPPDAGGPGSAVAGVVAALAAPPWNAVTGATVAVDGGVWMPA